MPDMDQGIKRLIQTHPQDVLTLMIPGAEYLGTLPADVATEPQLTLDTLMRVRYHGIECAVDLEAEARARPDIGRRLFEYGARAAIVTGLPIISAVLWLDPGGTAAPSPYELRADDRLLATWHFIGVEVYKLRADDIIALNQPGLLPLVAFSADRSDFTAIERSAELVKERAAPNELAELEFILAVFAARQFGADQLLALMRRYFMSTEIIASSDLYQQVVRETTERVERETTERVERDAVLSVLHGRFSDLPADIVEEVATASLDRLHDVLAHAGTDTLDELRARLQD